MQTATRNRLLLRIRQRLRRLERRRAFRTCIAQADVLRVVVGAGGISEEGWCHSDIDTLNLLDRANWRRAFGSRRIDAILAEHVWEHLTVDEGTYAAQMCFEFLKPGAYIRWAVPDGFHPSQEYQEWCRPGGTGVGADDHKVFYNHITASEMFLSVGFEVELKEYFDKQGCFHRADWDPVDGTIHRSAELDRRNSDGALRYTSLFLDARKPLRAA